MLDKVDPMAQLSVQVQNGNNQHRLVWSLLLQKYISVNPSVACSIAEARDSHIPHVTYSLIGDCIVRCKLGVNWCFPVVPSMPDVPYKNLCLPGIMGYLFTGSGSAST